MPENLVLAARRQEIACVHVEGVYDTVPMQGCKEADKKLLDLIWVDTDKSVDPAHKKIRLRLCARENETKKQGTFQKTPHLLLSCSLQCHLLQNGSETRICSTSSGRSAEVWWKQSWQVEQDASHTCQLDYVNLLCGEMGGFQRDKHSAALFRNAKLDVRMALRGDDFVCSPDEDGHNHNDSLLITKCTAREIPERLLLLNLVFRVETNHTGHLT